MGCADPETQRSDQKSTPVTGVKDAKVIALGHYSSRLLCSSASAPHTNEIPPHPFPVYRHQPTHLNTQYLQPFHLQYLFELLFPKMDSQQIDDTPQPMQSNGAPSANPEDVERVKGKWGEELNTAFQYEKYNAPQVPGGGAMGGGQWASTAVRYEWADDLEADAIAPRDEDLEKDLFGDDHEANMGINFDKYLPPRSLRFPPRSFEILYLTNLLSSLFCGWICSWDGRWVVGLMVGMIRLM